MMTIRVFNSYGHSEESCNLLLSWGVKVYPPLFVCPRHLMLPQHNPIRLLSPEAVYAA